MRLTLMSDPQMSASRKLKVPIYFVKQLDFLSMPYLLPFYFNLYTSIAEITGILIELLLYTF